MITIPSFPKATAKSLSSFFTLGLVVIMYGLRNVSVSLIKIKS